MRVLVNPDVYVGLPLEKQIMARAGRTENDPEAIIEIVCSKLEVKYSDLKVRNRTRPVVEAKCIAIGLILKVNPHYGLKKIGHLFGDMHHSSVIHLNNTFKDLYKIDKPFTRKVDTILQFV